jgi:SHOCT-like protein
MSAETKKILEMLAAGKLSAEDAERLLDKVSASAPSEPASSAASAQPGATHATGEATKAKKPRYLRIQVERPGRENVNMRVPLAFVRGGQLFSVLPASLTEKLQEHGIGIGAFSKSKLDDPEAMKALEELSIDIDKGDGKKVRIFAE